MDMGESLDTNNELMTVGISNLLSGLTGGMTGSYIFSQTIFTYRTGCRSRWIGILVALTFVAVVVSTVNFLEVTPLFFLGSTLLFIGFDLMFEWLIEVRHKLLFSEYAVLLATFFAIQFLGINGKFVINRLLFVSSKRCTNLALLMTNRRNWIGYCSGYIRLCMDDCYRIKCHQSFTSVTYVMVATTATVYQ